MQTTGRLSLVATPIGNLEDITYRAVRILHEADYILCEDTRVTKKLTTHYDVATNLRRYDANASDTQHTQIINDLRSGSQIALVSDAGSPGISDPGVRLVRMVREAGFLIEVIPGPSAVTAAVSLVGIAGNRFSFLGFVPQKKGRQTFLRTLLTYSHPVVCFESTHRIMKLLETLAMYWDEIEYQKHDVAPRLYVARELTKQYEEVLSGTPQSIYTAFEATPARQKGEFTVVFVPAEST